VLLLLGACTQESAQPGGEPKVDESALTSEDSLDSGPAADPEAAPVDEPEEAAPKKLPSVLGGEITRTRVDMAGAIERGILRVLVGYSQTHYFMDGLRIRGISAENLKRFEPFLHEHMGRPDPRINLLPVPVARDEMIEFLAAGIGDMAVGNITITEERKELVDFSVPLRRGVSELIVHGTGVEDVSTLEDLAGRSVHVRPSSSFVSSIEAQNETLAAAGLPPMEIVPMDERMQTEDILELVNAGVIAITVADSHMAEFWSEVLDGIVVRKDLALATDREIAWAIRKDLKELKPIVDDFVLTHREGTLVGNVLFQRYLESNRYVRNASASADRRRFEALADIFQRYSQDYEFDWLLIAAQAYQESRLIQTRRSPAGAIGVMQLLPSTAMSPAVSIPNIEELEANIHAGHKYLRHLTDHYFDDPEIDEMNRHLFAFAAYNAGPTRINRLRREAASRGLDPNRWFANVERIAAEKVGREPVTYVRNIFKYYVTYKLMQDEEAAAPPAVGAG
jgi:membrane-bound lytic murein transglycosylase MltF